MAWLQGRWVQCRTSRCLVTVQTPYPPNVAGLYDVTSTPGKATINKLETKSLKEIKWREKMLNQATDFLRFFCAVLPTPSSFIFSYGLMCYWEIEPHHHLTYVRITFIFQHVLLTSLKEAQSHWDVQCSWSDAGNHGVTVMFSTCNIYLLTVLIHLK